MSSPCLQRVSGVMTIDYLPEEYLDREVQDQQQMRALQRRLGSNFNFMVSLEWLQRGFPPTYAPFCGIAHVTVTHLGWELASLPGTVRHVIVSPDIPDGVPQALFSTHCKLVAARLRLLDFKSKLSAVQLWFCAQAPRQYDAQATFQALSREGVKLEYAATNEHILKQIMSQQQQQQGGVQQRQQEPQAVLPPNAKQQCCIA
jgi:hypothetical protein